MMGDKIKLQQLLLEQPAITQPAKKAYRTYFELFDKIDILLRDKNSINIAIDGMSGAGKTTLASLLSEVYSSNVFHTDDFFLSPELKTPQRLKEIGGNMDYVRFRKEIIAGLKSGREFKYHVYDCGKQAVTAEVTAIPRRVNIIEGAYSMHPTLIENYDLKVFMHIDKHKQKERILERNGPLLLERFINEWIPLENEYFQHMKIREQCNLVYEG